MTEQLQYGGAGEYPGGPSVNRCPFCQRHSRGEFEECGPAVPVMRFEPLNPVTPGHMLFVPFTHVGGASEHPTLTGLVFQAAARWGKEQNREYNLITSAGPNATQSVWHLHVHYVPRTMGDGLPLPWTGQREHDELRADVASLTDDVEALRIENAALNAKWREARS